MTTVMLPSGPHRPAVTFMDCDGVIFDANRVKVAAFEAALKDEPDQAREALIEHHKQTGRISRYEKLRHFYTEMVSVADPDSAIEAALARFSAASIAGYADLEPRAEALRFAAALGGPSSVYVVSGSDGGRAATGFRSTGAPRCLRRRARLANQEGSPHAAGAGRDGGGRS